MTGDQMEKDTLESLMTCLVRPVFRAGKGDYVGNHKSPSDLEIGNYRFLRAVTHEDLEKVYRLRYDVYCLELGVEPENPDWSLKDEYDDYAVNILAMDEYDYSVGTLRLIPNNPKGFPMESDFALKEYMRNKGISRAVEASKFAIRRYIETKDRGVIVLGIYICIFDYCREMNIDDLFTTTQDKVIKKYKMAGFEQIGEPFEYPPPLDGVLWLPMHCHVQVAHREYLKSRQMD